MKAEDQHQANVAKECLERLRRESIPTHANIHLNLRLLRGFTNRNVIQPKRLCLSLHFTWAKSDELTSFTKAVVCSYCDHLKLYMRNDGVEGTARAVLRVSDEFGNIRPYANDPIIFKLDGPAELIGGNLFSLIGGTGAVWVRAKEQAVTVSLTGTHPRLGLQKVEIALTSAPAEMI